MNKYLKGLLVCLLAINLLFTTNALAQLTENPAGVVKNVISKVKKSVNSIRSINVLSVIRGTVTLFAPVNITGSIRSIFIGNDSKLKRKKVIKVRGENDGSVVRLSGVGSTGEGYFFSFATPDDVNEFMPRKVKKISGALSSVVQVSYDEFEIELEGDRYKGSRSPRSATLKGTFSDRVPGGGVAKGRFSLRFSRR